MLFPLLLSLAIVPKPGQVETTRFRVSLPGKLSAPLNGVESTPWGETTTINYISDDQGWFRYTFTTYRFKRQRPLSPSKLRKSKSFFLRNRGCVANEFRTSPFKDSEGNDWPQIYLTGGCEADEGFRTLYLIAKNHLYRFTVAYECSLPPRPADLINSSDSVPPPPPPPPPPAEKLDQAIREFVASSQFKMPKDSVQ